MIRYAFLTGYYIFDQLKPIAEPMETDPEPSIPAKPDYEFPSSDCHIMIVDDDYCIREVMQTFVQTEGYACTVAPDGDVAFELMQEHEPDVVITDVDMPNMDGIELTKLVKDNFNSDVIIMTGFDLKHSYTDFINLGASDFVKKPVLPSEIVTRLKRVLLARAYKAAAESTHHQLTLAHAELQASYLDTIHRLVVATEYKDEDTADHIIRIGRYCSFLANQLGLPQDEVRHIGYAAPMHDIGKIGIPDQILLKPSKLTAEEFEIMKTHTTIGAKILENSKSDVLKSAQQIAISHHERWDGTGYPQGIAGKGIPLAGRIVALADAFDALTSRRPYKHPYSLEKTINIMMDGRGTQFDPFLLDLFLDHLDSILIIRNEVQNVDQDNLSDFLLNAPYASSFH
jgi:putative two-component system response regulator